MLPPPPPPAALPLTSLWNSIQVLVPPRADLQLFAAHPACAAGPDQLRLDDPRRDAALGDHDLLQLPLEVSAEPGADFGAAEFSFQVCSGQSPS